MIQDPRNILAYSRNLMLEQIIHCTGGNRARRDELEAMTPEQLRAEWNKAIGEPAEEVGV